MKVVQIAEIRHQVIKTEEQHILDARASIVVIEKALSFLNMNSMEELKDLKKEMNEKIKELKSIVNGKR